MGYCFHGSWWWVEELWISNSESVDKVIFLSEKSCNWCLCMVAAVCMCLCACTCCRQRHKGFIQVYAISAWANVQHGAPFCYGDRRAAVCSDHQLGYLSRCGFVDIVVTSDSDIMLHGATCILIDCAPYTNWARSWRGYTALNKVLWWPEKSTPERLQSKVLSEKYPVWGCWYLFEI